MRRSFLGVMAVVLVLVGAGACSNDEDGGDGHGQPESVRLFTAAGDEITAPYGLPSGATTRVEVRFYDEHGDDISEELAAGHQTALNFDPASFATVAPVTGEVFQRDVTVDAAVGTTASLSVGYGHDDADERTFGPFAFTAVAGAPTAVSVRFRPMVGTQPFSCTQSYTGIGTTGSTIEPKDFKMYIHHLRLIDGAGAEVPVALTQDGAWQLEDIALLDFEDQTGTCTNGTSQTRLVVEGTAPAGVYTGIRFVMGLPFDRNHGDATTAPSPLNLTTMFWSWNAGYKFLRADFNSTGLPGGFNIHLGSTGCNGASGTSVPTLCAQENLVEYTFTGFDPAAQVLVADLAALLAATDVDVNTATTAPGCMSSPSDPECTAIFSRLGLPFNGNPAGTQQFLTAGAL